MKSFFNYYLKGRFYINIKPATDGALVKNFLSPVRVWRTLVRKHMCVLKVTQAKTSSYLCYIDSVFNCKKFIQKV